MLVCMYIYAYICFYTLPPTYCKKQWFTSAPKTLRES